MAWAKFDDRFESNRKVRRAWRRSPAAVSLYVLAITYCSLHETDGLVDLDWVEDWLPAPRERTKILDVLTAGGMFEHVPPGETRMVDDADGVEITLGPVDVDAWVVHDYLAYNPSSVQGERTREWDRRRKELQRDPELIAAIRARDKDRCRYCGQQVNWKDRRGPAGATYDHVIPRGPNSFENVVVACRRCNTSKGGRTPEAASMRLLDPGALDHSPVEAEVVPRYELGRRADSAQVRPSTRPDPTRPDPTPIIPPLNPPTGGRRREHDLHREKMAQWAREEFPGLSVKAVTGYAAAAVGQGASTPEAVCEFVRRHTGQVAA